MAEYLNRYVEPLLTKETVDSVVTFTKEHKWAIFGASVAGYTLYRILQRPRNLPPGPMGYTFIGSELHKDFVRLGKKYGDIFSINVPGMGRMVILNSKKMIKDAFIIRGDDFAHRPHSNMFEALSIEEDVFTQPYNENWKMHKKFILNNLKNYGFGTREGEKKILFQIAAMTDYLRTKSNTEIDAKDIFQPIATNVITSIVYSEQLDLDDPELARVIKIIEDWISETFNEFALVLDLLPKWTYPIIMPFKWRKLVQGTEGLIEFVKGKLESHMKTFDPQNPRDVIDGFLMEAGENFNPRKMACHIMLFLPDAIYTLSIVLKYLFFLVCKYPEFQRQVQTQIDEVVGRSRQITVDDRTSLPLVEALFLESERITSLIIVSPPKIAQKDLDFAGYNIPKGSSIMANFYGVTSDEALFPEPDKFKPERHIDDQGAIKRTDAFYLFGIGRRSCIGEQLAKMEIFLVAANLLQQFSFSFPKDFTPYEDTEIRKTYKELPYPKLIITER